MTVELALEPRDEVHEARIQGGEDRAELDEIKSPVPELDFTDVRLSLRQPTREFHLSDARLLAGLAEEPEKDFVLLGVNRLFHPGLASQQVGR